MAQHSLKQLQKNFQAYMLQEDQAIVGDISNEKKAPAILRLDIYRNGYFLRLIDILAMDYPFVKNLMGKKLFEKLATQYIGSYPSYNFSIRIFGNHFSEFLTTHPESIIYWNEMANFEWKLAQVQDTEDAAELSLQQMASISPESWGGMQLLLQPSVNLAYFHSNVIEIWKACNENTKKPRSKQQKNPSAIIFWRYRQEAYFMPLTDHQLYMFKAIQTGKLFGEICEELSAFIPEEEVIQFAAGTLRSWVEEGLFSAVKIQAIENV